MRATGSQHIVEQRWCQRLSGLLDRLLFAPVPCSVELGDLWQSEMSVLRDDSRFTVLMQRLGLEDYLGRYGGPQFNRPDVPEGLPG